MLKDMPSNKLKVSIVCAWYNRFDYIKDTIDSLLSQNFESYEVIVINDGSTDKRVGDLLNTYTDSKLKVIHQNNMGFVHSIRSAIDLAKGEFIAIQGSGDISLQNRINDQYNLITSDENIVAVSCQVKTTRVGIDAVEEEISITKPIYKTLLNVDFMASENPFTHGEVMFRKSSYEKVGGYRSPFKFGQDRDLWLRLTHYGYCKVVNKVSYIRREFAFDGVSTDIDKLLLQFKLTSLAKQCNKERKNSRFDVVDKYNIYSFFYFKRDFSFKIKILKLIHSCMVGNDTEKAIVVMNELSYDSKLFNNLGSLVIALHKNRVTKKMIKLALYFRTKLI